MQDTDIRGLASIIAAYSGFEYLIKRFLQKRIEGGTSTFRTCLIWAGMLFVFLLVMTGAYFSPVLCMGYVVASILYMILQFTETSITTGSRSRSLESYVLKQVTMGVLLYVVWRIAQPLKVGEWYVILEELFFGPARIFHEYAYTRLPRILLILSCYFFAIDGGTRIVRGILRKFPRLYERAMASLRGNTSKESIRPIEEAEWLPLKEDDMLDGEEEENAGEWIGIFERILALTFVLTGNYTAIAFAVAAKSVARFKELENKDFAEYFLLGTSGSLVSAVVAGLVVRTLLNM